MFGAASSETPYSVQCCQLAYFILEIRVLLS